jgi:hypothetical protein
MLAFTEYKRDRIGLKQQPLYRKIETESEKTYCNRITGKSINTLYNTKKTFTDYRFTNLKARKTQEIFFAYENEFPENPLSFWGNFTSLIFTISETVHDQCISRGVVSDE